MNKRSFKENNSGQVIIITALLVALLLLSTVLYVIETEKTAPASKAKENQAFDAYKQSIKQTLISSLSNITNGGETSVLASNLARLESALTSQSYSAILKIEDTPLNSAPYQNGVWISWGTSGQGISSSYVSFVFSSSSPSASASLAYSVNVTSQVNVNGDYLMLEGTQKHVSLTVEVFNEGKPALARNFSVYYEHDGSLIVEEWIKVEAPSITDFGNGTYSISFNADTKNRNNPVLVSLYCHDQREVLVKTSVECTNIG